MPRTEENQTPLAQRVNDYLRSEGPTSQAFVGKESAAEVEMDEYLLQRAEAQLKAAQEQVQEIRDRLEARKQTAPQD